MSSYWTDCFQTNLFKFDRSKISQWISLGIFLNKRENGLKQGPDFSYLILLLYIELSNSFLIGRKRTVNFRNQRSWRHNCRWYNTLKFTCVIMSSARALCCFPSVKKHKHDFHFVFFQCSIKQLLDSVCVICRIIKVSVRVINLRRRVITLTSTLIILDITKTSSNNCL